MSNLKRVNGQTQPMSTNGHTRGFTVAQAEAHLQRVGYTYEQHTIDYHVAPDATGLEWTLEGMSDAALLCEIESGGRVTWFTIRTRNGQAGDVTFMTPSPEQRIAELEQALSDIRSAAEDYGTDEMTLRGICLRLTRDLEAA